MRPQLRCRNRDAQGNPQLSRFRENSRLGVRSCPRDSFVGGLAGRRDLPLGMLMRRGHPRLRLRADALNFCLRPSCRSLGFRERLRDPLVSGLAGRRYLPLGLTACCGQLRGVVGLGTFELAAELLEGLLGARAFGGAFGGALLCACFCGAGPFVCCGQFAGVVGVCLFELAAELLEGLLGARAFGGAFGGALLCACFCGAGPFVCCG
ncbi:hypothetical protein DQP57_20530 [Mycobacterium colombiense]|uniref:Uncharacterized protein n=1 Tax=Mycobacterium colombiense TaxID=339268 RepID=A0A329LG83_9MYCO|nr:hypothetical protein DQP57_20530 [Mycobacterium colombiense]